MIICFIQFYTIILYSSKDLVTDYFDVAVGSVSWWLGPKPLITETWALTSSLPLNSHKILDESLTPSLSFSSCVTLLLSQSSLNIKRGNVLSLVSSTQ